MEFSLIEDIYAIGSNWGKEKQMQIYAKYNILCNNL